MDMIRAHFHLNRFTFNPAIIQGRTVIDAGAEVEVTRGKSMTGKVRNDALVGSGQTC